MLTHRKIHLDRFSLSEFFIYITLYDFQRYSTENKYG